ncbi:uncharacterized protein CCOS01_05895 [Colletotrichum costaricense]|uniref:Uncharacterized protein n=1 Tax=Colletotrichum costaricense TaxID=1209916 RepID=A0AAI9Z0Z9_9PEZI|nr:uncharacterized protein CCOS01_05895 [Colletotrichum costaricense]KAK1530792.1 hypothetical protein CCOS01_05895 [Colletotrichum costaricense]
MNLRPSSRSQEARPQAEACGVPHDSQDKPSAVTPSAEKRGSDRARPDAAFPCRLGTWKLELETHKAISDVRSPRSCAKRKCGRGNGAEKGLIERTTHRAGRWPIA